MLDAGTRAGASSLCACVAAVYSRCVVVGPPTGCEKTVLHVSWILCKELERKMTEQERARGEQAPSDNPCYTLLKIRI